MAKNFKAPPLAQTGQKPAQAPVAPKASPDPAKASTPANVQTTFGTPKDTM